MRGGSRILGFVAVGLLVLTIASGPAVSAAVSAAAGESLSFPAMGHGVSARRGLPFDDGAPASPSRTARPIPDRYIVVLEDGADPDGVAAPSAARHGLVVRHVYRAALRGFAASIPSTALAAIAADPAVAFVAPDRTLYAAAQVLPTGVDRIEADRNDTARIDGVDIPVDVGIAILDTGVDLDHPDLNVVQGLSFMDREPSPDDLNGHGTHVAGTAAARDNGIGVVGAAPGARLYALKVLDRTGTGSFADVIAAIDWVTANAGLVDVASLSLSATVVDGDDGNCGRTNRDALHLAICNSVAAGVTYVVAAGNEKMDAKDAVPAAYDEVLTVSALSDLDGTPLDDRFTFFSNFGPDVDLTAPGRDILSTWPGGGTMLLTGTSMATPHVSGAAALFIASVRRATGVRPTPNEVAAALARQAEPAPAGGWPGDSDGIPEPLVRVRDRPAGPVDSAASVVAVRPTRIEADDESRATAIAMPRDAQGNLIGPGREVAFTATAGSLLGAPTDGGTDLYTQALQAFPAPAGTTAAVTATVDSVALSQAARLVFTEDLRIHGPTAIASTPEDELDMAVASNGGSYLVAWGALAADGTTASVRFARTGLDGTSLDPTPRPLATVSLSQATDVPVPRVASDGTNYLVVWLDRGALVRASDGAVLATVVFDSSDARSPASVAFGGGRFLVAWYEFDARAKAYGLLGQFVRPDGTLDGRQASVLLSAISPAIWVGEAPGIAFDGANFLAAFSRIRIGPCPSNPAQICALDSDVWAARVSPSGFALAPGAFRLSAASAYERFPAVASDGATSLVAWESVTADVETGVIAAAAVDAVRLGSDGGILDATPIRLEGPPDLAFGPVVAPAGMGTFLVAWTNGSHPDDWDVSGARIRGATGEVLDPEGFSIAAAPADQLAPAVAASEANLFVTFIDFGRYATSRADLAGQLVRRVEPPIDAAILAPWTLLALGQTMSVTVVATAAGAPVSSATVTATAEPEGVLGVTPATGTTDGSGRWTTVVRGIAEGVATLMVSVAKPGFRTGSAALTIEVGTHTMTIALTSDRHEMMSFETATINIRLTDALTAAGVEAGQFTILSPAGGNVSAVTELGGGDYRFRWDAPWVTTQTFAQITVRAKVGGYTDVTERITILVDPNKTNPGSQTQLFLIGMPEKTTLLSGETITVTLHLFTIEGFAVSGATVTVSCPVCAAIIQIVDGVADRHDGVYTFELTAGFVSGPTAVSIRVDAAKFGYASGTARLGFLILP